MKRFINKNKIIEAFIVEPYKNCGEVWDMGNTHNWQVKLIVGYLDSGYPIEVTIESTSELKCIDIINEIGLHPIQ